MSKAFTAIARAAQTAGRHAALLGSRLRKIIFSDPYTGVEAYLVVPTVLLSLRVFQTAGDIPLYIPGGFSQPSEHSLMIAANAFWQHTMPLRPFGYGLLANALLMLLALTERHWGFRYAMVTWNLGFWFYFSAITWMHLGPGGSWPYVAGIVAAVWVHRRLLMERIERQNRENQTLASAMLVGDIISLFLPETPRYSDGRAADVQTFYENAPIAC